MVGRPTVEEVREALGSAPKGQSIHERMVTVLAKLPAIGKDQRNPQQNFMFRGHDDILNALNPLLGEHGIYIIPDVLERLTDQRPVSGNRIMFEVNLHVRFRFYGAGGDYVEATTWGEGTDMGDKATNKAMTMAFKNVLNQAFAISSAEFQDNDGATPETTVRQESASRGFRPATSWPELLERFGHISGAQEDAAEWIREAIAARFNNKETSDLMRNEKVEALRRSNMVLAYLEEHFAGSFPPPDRDQVAKAFAESWEGVALHGPPWRIGASDPEGLPLYDDYILAKQAEADQVEPTDEPEGGGEHYGA